MKLRTLALALAVALATFLFVGVGVAQVVGPYVGYSLFVSLPAGILAGVAAAAFVVTGFDAERGTHRRTASVALARFGVGFVAAFVVGALLSGAALAVVVGSVTGLAAAAGTLLRRS